MKTSVKRRAKNCIRGAVLLACFIAVWYVASCFTQPLFIPAPATVWEAIVGLAETGQLQKGLAYSFLRITGASALSMLVAIPLSLLIYGVKPIKGNYHAGCFLPAVCSRNRIFSAPDPMVWDWGADENFVPIYCNVCLLAAVDPALL